MKRDFDCIYLNYFPNNRLLNCAEHFRYLASTSMTSPIQRRLQGYTWRMDLWEPFWVLGNSIPRYSLGVTTWTRFRLACSRLRDSGESEKAFKNKKTRGRGGETGRPPPPLCQVARVLFSLCLFNTSPLYYVRGWHRLGSDKLNCDSEHSQGCNLPGNPYLDNWLGNHTTSLAKKSYH